MRALPPPGRTVNRRRAEQGSRPQAPGSETANPRPWGEPGSSRSGRAARTWSPTTSLCAPSTGVPGSRSPPPDAAGGRQHDLKPPLPAVAGPVRAVAAPEDPHRCAAGGRRGDRTRRGGAPGAWRVAHAGLGTCPRGPGRVAGAEGSLLGGRAARPSPPSSFSSSGSACRVPGHSRRSAWTLLCSGCGRPAGAGGHRWGLSTQRDQGWTGAGSTAGRSAARAPVPAWLGEGHTRGDREQRAGPGRAPSFLGSFLGTEGARLEVVRPEFILLWVLLLRIDQQCVK